jgi:BirA family transcriptional regulator, biotin operon repressor / biotin---[acetyl-CoA-carboxylase] ligase
MTAQGPVLPPGYRLYRFDTVGSTNDEAKRLARDGTSERTVVWALEQTKGRGRRGRSWASPRGNLFLSLLLRPRASLVVAAQLGFVAAVAIAESLPFPPEIAISCKWPNDVLVRGRKIAGILLESETGEEGRLAYLVLGVGVNCVSFPSDTEFPATSIAEEGGGALSPAALLERFLARFDASYRRWQEEGFQWVRAAWLQRAAFLGERLTWRLEKESLVGRFLDLDEKGALLLERDGETRRIAAGEVFPEKA